MPPDPGRERFAARNAAYKGISAGTFLVCTGVVLLMNTAGELPWSIWIDLFRLWPVLLISLGLRLLFVRTPLHPLSLVGPLLLVAAVALTVSWRGDDRAARAWEDWTEEGTEAIACGPPEPGRPARLDLALPGGNLRLTARGAGTAHGAEGFTGDLWWSGEVPWWRCDESGDLRIGRPLGRATWNLLFPAPDRDRRWESSLTSTSPVDLHLEIAAGGASLDLRGMALSDLHLRARGAGVDLSLGPPPGRVPVRIAGAVARVDLTVPEGTCVSARRGRRLALLDLEGRRIRRRAGTVFSDGCAGGAPSDPNAPIYEIYSDLPIAIVSVSAGPAGG